MWTRLGIAFCLIFAFGCGNPTSRTDQRLPAAGNNDSTIAKQQAGQANKNILFFGTSLTAGMGLEDQSTSFPAVIQEHIDSLDLPYRVINGGLSGETSAAGSERIDWLLNEQIDVFVLELGANDGLRGIPTEETRTNLQRIVDKVKAKYPDCKLVLAGMMVPPSMGGDYGKAFSAIFPALAAENGMAFVPFLLEGVAGETDLNQHDGIHPTEEGHRIMAANVWQVLEPLL